MTGSFMTLAMLLLANPAMAQQCMHVSGARIAFEIIQDGAPFSGEFAEGGGRVCMDGERIISIEAWLAPASVNTGLPELDAALQEAEFFDTRKFPRVAFTSKDIETAAQAYIAHGELQVKERTVPTSVPFALEPAPATTRISGSLTLDRLALGIGSGEWADTRWLGAEVKVSFSAMLEQ